MRYFVKKDPSFDLSSIAHREWDELVHACTSEFSSIIGTSDPDLSEFRNAGGKMLNWHGTADQAIPYNGSVSYYDRVLEKDPNAHEFYRLFLAPGADHTTHVGIAPSFEHTLGVIVDWVENNVAPDTLSAKGLDGLGRQSERPLCAYPRVQHYVGGDPTVLEAFTCV